jgi:hypothetical protein
MKTIILKNMLPIVIAVLGISGAFVTTAMQKSASKTTTGPVIGYLVNPVGKCMDVVVTCSDFGPSLCRLGVTSGPVAYQKDEQNNCIQALYRP